MGELISAADFKRMTGRRPDPASDDLARANCKQAGKPGHLSCGVCAEHGTLRFECGCLALSLDAAFQQLAAGMIQQPPPPPDKEGG